MEIYHWSLKMETNFEELERELGVMPHEDPMAQIVARDEMIAGMKKKAIDAINSIQVEQHGVFYDGDPKAQHNMSAVGTVANWRFNQAVLMSLDRTMRALPDDSPLKPVFAIFDEAMRAAYNNIYHNSKIQWTGADNSLHNVQIESILESLEQSMRTVGEIVHHKAKSRD